MSINYRRLHCVSPFSVLLLASLVLASCGRAAAPEPTVAPAGPGAAPAASAGSSLPALSPTVPGMATQAAEAGTTAPTNGGEPAPVTSLPTATTGTSAAEEEAPATTLPATATDTSSASATATQAAAEPAARALVYARADGSLWRVEQAGQEPVQILAAQEGWQLAAWSISPDGARLALVRTLGLSAKPVAGDTPPQIALWLAASDGSNARQLLDLAPTRGIDLTPGEADAFDLVPALTGLQELAWSPDSTRLAFVSAHEGQVDLYLAAQDGAISRLTDSAELEQGPAWSPDGQYLALRSTLGFGTGAGWADVGLVVVAATGVEVFAEQPIAMTAPPMGISTLVWIGPDELVYGLPSMMGSGGEVRSLVVDSGRQQVIFTGALRQAVWSAEAQALAIASDDFGAEAEATNPGLYLWRPGEAKAQALLPEIVPGELRWNSRGQLAYSVDEDEQRGIWVLPATGGEPQHIALEPTYSLVWSPDGTLLAAGPVIFSPDHGGSLLALPGHDAMPLIWGPQGLFFSASEDEAGTQVLHLWDGSRFTVVDAAAIPFGVKLVP